MSFFSFYFFSFYILILNNTLYLFIIISSYSNGHYKTSDRSPSKMKILNQIKNIFNNYFRKCF